MATFIIQINPSDDGSAEGVVIYNPLGTPTVALVRQWAYEGRGELYRLRLLDNDIIDVIQVDDIDVINPVQVTGLITELPRKPRA